MTDTMKEITSVEKNGKIEIIETVDKAEYITKCEGQLEHQREVIAFAQAEVAYLEAELAKYKIEVPKGK